MTNSINVYDEATKHMVVFSITTFTKIVKYKNRAYTFKATIKELTK